MYQRGVFMNVGACVLIYGRDPVLLETRTQILRQGGFRIVAISALQEFLDLQSHDFRVFVLCHTLSAKDQQEAIEAGRKANRSLRTIVMAVHEPKFKLGHRTSVINPFEGPEALTASVREAMWREGEDSSSSTDNELPMVTRTFEVKEARQKHGWIYRGNGPESSFRVTCSTG
jgi:DNA-binding NtrC family response regulator